MLHNAPVDANSRLVICAPSQAMGWVIARRWTTNSTPSRWMATRAETRARIAAKKGKQSLNITTSLCRNDLVGPLILERPAMRGHGPQVINTILPRTSDEKLIQATFYTLLQGKNMVETCFIDTDDLRVAEWLDCQSVLLPLCNVRFRKKQCLDKKHCF